MRVSRLTATLAAVATVAAVAACADSSVGNNTNTSTTPQQLATTAARHIDTLWSETSNSTREQFLSIAEAGPAFGGVPLNTGVFINGQAVNWETIEIEEVDTNSSGVVVDSSYVVVAYGDANLSTAIGAQIVFNGPTPTVSGFLISSDSVLTADSTVTMTASTATPSVAPCYLVTGLTNPAILTAQETYGCSSLENLNANIALTFPHGSAVTTVQFNAEIYGPRFVLPY
jgi:hypothetical protein